MIKFINQKNDSCESGAIIKDGTITPYSHVDFDEFFKDLREFKDDYHNGGKPKDMHHIARLEASVIENIRITNKWPNNQEGFNLAVKEAVKMVKNGELKAFAVHEA